MITRHEKVEYSDPNIPIYCKEVTGKLSTDIHLHEEIEIVYILSGSITFYFPEDAVEVTNGNILIVNSSVPHYTKENRNGNTVEFLLKFRPEQVIGKNNITYPYLSVLDAENKQQFWMFNISESENYSEIANAIVGLSSELQEKKTAYELNAISYIYKIVTMLFRYDVINCDTLHILSAENGMVMEKFSSVFSFIENHYNEPITLDTVAKLTNYSRQHFCRLFKATTGKSFVEYLNSFRVNVAKNMLINTNEPIYNVYIKAGFSSFSYFNRVFKANTGVSPSEYRTMF